jgi:dihydroorotate dehydrogenase (fumarate)
MILEERMDLSTRYMGLTLKNPLVASASPISERLDNIRRLEDAGAAAVVLFSLFEEQIEADARALELYFGFSASGDAEAASYLPGANTYHVGPDAYLELIRRAREAVDIPVIASLNGTSERGWTHFAAAIEHAGASALELNVNYIPTERSRSGRQVEQQYLDVYRAVRSSVKLPLALKLGPYFSSFACMASELDEAGVDGLVLFNRFYQPDFDIETRTVVPSISFSRPQEIRLPLMWIALLHGHLRASLAATTGVHSATEVIKYLMAGADVVMTTAALLKEGPTFITKTLGDLADWMERQGYQSVGQLRGCMSHRAVGDATGFVRANYIRTLESYTPSGPWGPVK